MGLVVAAGLAVTGALGATGAAGVGAAGTAGAGAVVAASIAAAVPKLVMMLWPFSTSRASFIGRPLNPHSKTPGVPPSAWSTAHNVGKSPTFAVSMVTFTLLLAPLWTGA